MNKPDQIAKQAAEKCAIELSNSGAIRTRRMCGDKAWLDCDAASQIIAGYISDALRPLQGELNVMRGMKDRFILSACEDSATITDLESQLATAQEELKQAQAEAKKILDEYSSIQGNGLRLANLLATSQEELAELRKDKARLDWLEEHSTSRWAYGNQFMIAADITCRASFEKRPTIREAIDAALTEPEAP